MSDDFIDNFLPEGNAARAMYDAHVQWTERQEKERQKEQCQRLRDKFAMAALQGMLAAYGTNTLWGDVAPTARTASQNAYVFADAMLAQRDKVEAQAKPDPAKNAYGSQTAYVRGLKPGGWL